MKLVDRITVLIPTYNRPLFVRKLLRYYSQFDDVPCLIVADSSQEPFLSANRDTVRSYSERLPVLHAPAPNRRPIQACHFVASSIRTPYAFLTGDDDYLVPRVLIAFADFLDRSPDYNIAIANCVRPHLQIVDSHFEVLRILLSTSSMHSVESPHAWERLLDATQPILVNTFGCQRTENFKEVMRLVSEGGFEEDPEIYSHAEIFQIGQSVLRGKQKHLPDVYLYMSVLPQSKLTPNRGCMPSMVERIASPNWGAGMEKVLKLWAEQIVALDRFTTDEALNLAAQAWTRWQAGFFSWRSPVRRTQQWQIEQLVSSVISKAKSLRARNPQPADLERMFRGAGPWAADFAKVRAALTYVEESTLQGLEQYLVN